MKRLIAIVLTTTMTLSLFLIGCGGTTDDQTASGTDVVAETEDSESAEASTDYARRSVDGYLDESTGIYHEPIYQTDIEIRFSLPDGYEVMDGLASGKEFTTIILHGDKYYLEAFPIMIHYDSNNDAQALYDSMNQDGTLGVSHEIVFGEKTYISNADPMQNGITYYFCKTATAPTFYFGTVSVNENGSITDPAVIEEVLSTFTY